MSKKLFTSMCALAAMAFCAAAPSYGASLNLVATAPDIHLTNVTVNFNGSTGRFDATGTASSITLPGGSITNFGSGSFSLTGFLDTSANPVANALTNLTVIGDGKTYLQSNTLLKFGFTTNPSSVPQTFEFVFGPSTLPIGVILNVKTTIIPNFALTSTFANSGTGTGDAFVPLPQAATMGLSTLSLLPLAKVLRRRRI